MPSPIVNRERK